MILDAQMQFADAQALTADAVSDNVIDLGEPRDIGVGERLYIMVSVQAAITGTLQVNVETDDNEAFSSATVSADMGSFALNAAAGDRIVYAIPPAVANERYLRLDFNGATGGSVDANVLKDADLYTFYPKGYTVS